MLTNTEYNGCVSGCGARSEAMMEVFNSTLDSGEPRLQIWYSLAQDIFPMRRRQVRLQTLRHISTWRQCCNLALHDVADKFLTSCDIALHNIDIDNEEEDIVGTTMHIARWFKPNQIIGQMLSARRCWLRLQHLLLLQLQLLRVVLLHALRFPPNKLVKILKSYFFH